MLILQNLYRIIVSTKLRNNIRETVATFLACGIDHKKSVIFNQSQVSAHSEAAWILGCTARMGWLNRMTQFKEKAGKDKEKASIGLYSYPVLMAADILLYDAELVPVGKDQLQHLEMARDIASRFNHSVKKEILVAPEAVLQENNMLVPGTDGEKMSKSRDNCINVFLSEKQLKKYINKKIITDDTPLEQPKVADQTPVYELYKQIAPAKAESMNTQLAQGGYGWGHAKQDLSNELLSRFSDERGRYEYYMSNPDEIDKVLFDGAEKARKVASATLTRVREVTGY